ncbi:MAG TPA: Ig-like domain-containing protein [Candidatus Sulfotelmatobacter sp.]|nr:Ig-like domain-containing protein [Candidatus Sulfotelmatobacter sp.]
MSGSDVTGPPISTAITDPGTGQTSASVVSSPITTPNNSLLISWVKNETGANATALNAYSLDGQSTSFLWAESQTATSGGSYTDAFQYDSATGWQTAIVGLKPSLGPVASNQTVLTQQDTPVNIILTATSPQGYPLTYTVLTQPSQGTLSGAAPDLTYSPNAGYTGSDSFTFLANDGTSNSNVGTISITVHGLAPIVNSTVGYINPTPLTAHTSQTFNTIGASMLVAFVSSHPLWNGLPVSLAGVTDNIGNTWTLLTGPTQFSGSSFTLMSAIYYVNSPATSLTHTVTAQLTNPAPLVLQVFAVSQSDVTGAPIFSPITDPGAGGASASVASTSITVPINSLLLSWVKNETAATATATNGYTLDSQSVSFLWAESETPFSAGSYTGNFQYDSAIGWQTATLGVKPRIPGPPPPVINSMPANPTNQTSASFGFTDTPTSGAFVCALDAGTFSSCVSPATFTGFGEGSHTFSVKAQDNSGNQSGSATFNWVVDTTAPPVPGITSNPTNPTTQTSANFTFTETEAGVTFLCQLDTGAFTACSSPSNYSSLTQGSHTFSVEAQDSSNNRSTATSFTWNIDTIAPPTPVLTSTPPNVTSQTSATFQFTDTETAASLFCQLDNGTFSSCTSPITYSGLPQGTHSFAAKAQDAAGNQSASASFSWTVETTPPPQPVINSTPTNPSNQTTASLGFSDTEAGVSFVCQLDGGAFTSCTSPKSYSGLSQKTHTFGVKAQDAAANQSVSASFTWTVDTTPPPKPLITSGPPSTTRQTSATFGFIDSQAGVTFLCQLDNSAFTVCTSPTVYAGPLARTKHTFSLRAQDPAGDLSGTVTYKWTIQ